MKKIIAMVAALATVSSFAGMVTHDLVDYTSNTSTTFSPKFSKNTEGNATDDIETMNISANYAHELANGGQVQVLFNRYSYDNGTKDGTKMTLGVGYIHNMNASDLKNSMYVAGRYLMVSCDDDDNANFESCAKDKEWTVIEVEAGKRFEAFKTGNFTWSWSPSVKIEQETENDKGDDQTDLNISLYLAKFDLFF